MFLVGDTFIIPIPRAKYTEHLFIVLAVNKAKGELLMVNVSTIKNNCDNTCIIKKYSHPFIKHDSYIYYAGAIITDILTIKAAIRGNAIRSHQAVTQELLEKILEEARTSTAMPTKCKEFIS